MSTLGMTEHPATFGGERVMEPTTQAFRRAMQKLDMIVRQTGTEEIKTAYKGASDAGLVLVDQFDAISKELYYVREVCETLRKEMRTMRDRQDYRDSREAALEVLYLKAKADIDDISAQANRLNEQKNEVTRFARTLESSKLNLSIDLEEMKKLRDSYRTQAECERATAKKANEDRENALSKCDEAAETIAKLRQELKDVRLIARRRSEVLKQAADFVEADKAGNETASSTKVVAKLRQAAALVDLDRVSKNPAGDFAGGEFTVTGWQAPSGAFWQFAGFSREAFTIDTSPEGRAILDVFDRWSEWMKSQITNKALKNVANPTKAALSHSWEWDDSAGQNRCAACGKLVSDVSDGFCDPQDADADGINRQAETMTVAEAIAAAE